MLKEVFKNYDPEKRYDIICGCNEYVETEGLFPAKLKTAQNRKCVLCDKYGLRDSRILRKNFQGTRDVWVHPRMKNCLLSGADNKNMKYQSNVKTGYCRLCKCCHGRTGDEGGWCKGVCEGRVHDLRTIEEDNHASKEWEEEFHTFEEELYRES